MSISKSNEEKPQGKQVGYRVLETSYPFENPMSRLRSDRVEVAGEEMNYAYLERAQGVIIVPLTKGNELAMIRQYRYPCDDWCLEVPAGGTHDTGDMPLEEVARKELEEELGATCESLEYVSAFYSCGSITNEECHVFLARGVELRHQAHTESSEAIDVQLLPVAEAINQARKGEMRNAPCALAVLLCEPLLKTAQV
jgi:ADP-ribose pyrophosphatase